MQYYQLIKIGNQVKYDMSFIMVLNDTFSVQICAYSFEIRRLNDWSVLPSAILGTTVSDNYGSRGSESAWAIRLGDPAAVPSHQVQTGPPGSARFSWSPFRGV